MSDLFGTAWWSNTELAEVFGISPQRLGVLCKQGVIPNPENGLHEPKTAVASYVRHLKLKDANRSQAGEAVTKIQLENDMRRIKLQRIAGDLVLVDRVQKDFFDATRRVRAALLNLPSRLSGVFAAESNQANIFESFTKEIHEVLTELSSRQFGLAVTESLPLEDVPIQAPAPQQANKLDGPIVGETPDQDCEPDRFSTGD